MSERQQAEFNKLKRAHLCVRNWWGEVCAMAETDNVSVQELMRVLDVIEAVAYGYATMPAFRHQNYSTRED